MDSSPAPDVVSVDWSEAAQLAAALHERVSVACGEAVVAYPIPRGGLFVAALLATQPEWQFTNVPAEADVAIDDVIDSGATARRMRSEHALATYALIDKGTWEHGNSWIAWPWDVGGRGGDLRDTIIRLCQQTGVELPLP